MRALVTGAANGIGRGICIALAGAAKRRGDSLSIAAVDLHADQLGGVLDELRALGVTATGIQADLGTPEGPAQAVAKSVEALGGLDTLVSNAGIGKPSPLMALSLEDWDRVFAINTRATWLLAQAAHAALKEARGSIVVTASIASVHPQPNLGAYGPSKAAVLMLVQVMAQELAKDGIRVNAVSPGWVRTAATEKAYANPDFAALRDSIVPLGRVATPADVGDVVAFLADQQARYVTGQNIIVDGGLGGHHMGRMPAVTSIKQH